MTCALRERLPEGHAVARPGQGLVETGLREGAGGGRHRQPLAVEVGHEDLKALVLGAQQMADRHAHVVEMQMRGVGAPPAHLLERRARESGRIGIDQQGRHARGALRARIGAHGHGDEVGAHAGGDEGLLAVQHIVLALAPRGAFERCNVGTAAGLGDRQRGDLVAGEHGRHHAPLECFAAMRGHGWQADGVRQQRSLHAAAARARHLLDRDEVMEDVGRRAAERFVVADAEGTQGTELAIELARKGFGLVPVVRERDDLAVDEFAQRRSEDFMLGAEVVRSGRVSIIVPPSSCGARWPSCAQRLACSTSGRRPMARAPAR